MFAVNLYLVDRAYGGSEEGGWYFDCGEPVQHPPEHIYRWSIAEHPLQPSILPTQVFIRCHLV